MAAIVKPVGRNSFLFFRRMAKHVASACLPALHPQTLSEHTTSERKETQTRGRMNVTTRELWEAIFKTPIWEPHVMVVATSHRCESGSLGLRVYPSYHERYPPLQSLLFQIPGLPWNSTSFHVPMEYSKGILESSWCGRCLLLA